MLHNEQQQLILQLAVERGLLNASELAVAREFSAHSDSQRDRELRWGRQISALIQEQLLDEAIINKLLLELEAETVHKQSTPNSPTLKYPNQQTKQPINTSSTRTPNTNSGRKSLRDFPVTDWDRYQFIDFIGAGGMGRVFKARDLRLNRIVALKFIRGDDSDLLERFFREAQAQARINHTNICKVYEVGEVNELPYIAMEFIDGISLKDAKERLTLDQKVKIIQEVADALQAAHRLSLIHRDIKPANIMLTQQEDGSWQPFVMDFGLVREVDQKGQTVTGQIMGTPAYMAPEQALGKIHLLDRRTDVYSLGATLYDLLTGSSPFDGATGLEIMLKVVKDEPLPLRKHLSDIPSDLETIVMKCLEKEPALRYESAKALAQDLQRYLDGDPIKARRASWGYLAVKLARKHREVVITATIGLLLLSIFSGLWLRARWTARLQAEQAQERARVSQQFGQQIKEIEAIMRYAHLAPLHDIQREQQIIKQRMKLISQQMEQLGAISAGPGNYALGRGYLALQDYANARKYLELAYRQGFNDAEVGFALGTVLGELYRRALEEARRTSSPDALPAVKQQLEKEFRDPALQYLKQSSNRQLEAAPYAEGLIALYEGHYEQALSQANQAFQQVPWLYEAIKLKGDVYLIMGEEKKDRGDLNGAAGDYQNAGAAYQIAIDMARSDPAVYESECARWIQLMELDDAQGRSPQAAFDQTMATAAIGLTADPNNANIFLLKAQAHYNLSDHFSLRSDPSAAIANAIEMAQQVIKLKPNDAQAFNIIGKAWELKSVYQRSNGSEWRVSMDKALESFQQAIKIAPNYAESIINIGLAYWRLGEAEMSYGKDPTSHIRASIEAFNHAAQVNPNNTDLFRNLGNVYVLAGEYEEKLGIDPRKNYRQAIQYFDQAIKLNPSSVRAHNSRSIVYEEISQYEIFNGLNPLESIQQIIEGNQRAIQLNPNFPYAYNRLGLADQLRADYELTLGQNPNSYLDRAITNYQKAIELYPTFAKAFINLTMAHRTRAKYQLMQNIDPIISINKARETLQKSRELNPDAYYLELEFSKIELIAAQWAMTQKESPQQNFNKINAALQKAIKKNSQENESYFLMANMCRLQAEWLISRGQSSREAIAQGITFADQGISIKSRNAEAFAEKGALLLIKSGTLTDNAEKQKLMTEGNNLLQQALRLSPVLKQDFQAFLIENR